MSQSRKIAVQNGEIKYLSNRACPKGHIGLRYVKDYKCVECRVINSVAWVNANKERHANSVKKCNAKHKVAYALVRKARYEQDKVRVLEQQKEYRLKNLDRVKAKNQKYQSLNKALGAAKTARYRAAQNQRTPTWLTEDDHWMIEQAYELAALRSKMFGFVWDVDHVIPLRGKLVSGLHVPTNLRVIPASENRSKRNKFEAVT